MPPPLLCKSSACVCAKMGQMCKVKDAIFMATSIASKNFLVKDCKVRQLGNSFLGIAWFPIFLLIYIGGEV
jgi:hypothetical protein